MIIQYGYGTKDGDGYGVGATHASGDAWMVAYIFGSPGIPKGDGDGVDLQTGTTQGEGGFPGSWGGNHYGDG